MKEYEPDWDIKLPHPSMGRTMQEITGDPDWVSPLKGRPNPNKGKTYKKRKVA